MSPYNRGIILPADDLDEAFRIAAAQLAYRQGEQYRLSVHNSLAEVWCAQILARNLGWDVRSELYGQMVNGLYDGAYHNFLIHNGIEHRLLSRAMGSSVPSSGIVQTDSIIGLSYEFRSISLIVKSPE